MDNLTTCATDTPSGSRIGDGQTKRTRSRTRAQRTDSRYRQSYEVEVFNQQEQERERTALLKATGEISEMIDSVRDFSIESSLLIAVAGYLNWFIISGHYVELSRHTEASARKMRPWRGRN